MNGRRPVPSLADNAVVAAVLAGDRDAYAELVRRYWPRIRSALARMLGPGADVDDLAQESFVRAYYALGSFDPAYRFSTWLYQIAFNLAINHNRKRRRELTVGVDAVAADTFFASIPDAEPSGQPEAATAARDMGARLWQAVADLPPDAREIVIMRHVLELSYQEICAATGLPMGTVKSRLERARNRLAGALGLDA